MNARIVACGDWKTIRENTISISFLFFFFFFYSQSLKEERMMLRRWNEIFHDFYIRTIIDVVKDYRVSRSSIPFLCFCFSQVK